MNLSKLPVSFMNNVQFISDSLVQWIVLLLVLFNIDMALAQQSKPIAVSGEYIIQFKSSVGRVSPGQSKAAAMAVASKMATEKGLRIVSALKTIGIKKTFSDAGMLHLHSVSKAKLDFLKSHPDVEFIEPNYVMSVDPVSDANPPPENSANGVHSSPTDTFAQNYAPVQVTQSWAVETPDNQGTKTVVAVVDSGLDMTHAVFADSNGIWTNTAELYGQAGVDDDGNGYIDDVHGWNFVSGSSTIVDDNNHGTHVSGIILGVGQDIEAYPVRESKLKIMPLKFLDSSGSGTTSNAISAIYYAVNNGARVINNSWGGSNYSRALHEAYTYAYNHNVVVVSAAGNSAQNISTTPMYPAALDTPSNITVAATTDSDRLASFSNYSSSLVQVAAPGSYIVSTVPGSSCSAPGCLAMMSGTSMAAPFVAGLAGLIIREATQLSAYQVRGIILGSVDTISYLSNKVSTNGRVNALKAIQSALTNTSTTAWSPSYSPVYKVESSSYSTSAAPAAGGCGLVKAVVDEMNDSGGGSGSSGNGSSVFDVLFVLIVLAAPAALGYRLRQRQYVRRYERYDVSRNIIVQIGDHVVTAATETLSMGGLSLTLNDPEAATGQIVKIKMDDQSQEIEAQIVWSKGSNSFGIKFLQTNDNLQAQIQQWCCGLVPIS